MGTIARFACTERREHAWNSHQPLPDDHEPGPAQVDVKLEAVKRATEDNVDWSEYTPVGELTMTITNPDAFRQFVVGQDYYLEIRKVQPAKARSSSD